jgi:hypothetical protein
MFLTLSACEKGYKAPRTSFGDPDLQGVWTNLSMTRLETPSGYKGPVLSPETARADEYTFKRKTEKDGSDFFRLNTNKPSGKVLLGYNKGWLEKVENFAVIDGKPRVAWIYDPPDGKIPYKLWTLFELTEWRMNQKQYENPETIPIWDRCLLGFGGPAGPPMLNQIYNSAYQIVQSPGHVAIWVEMVHDVRIIRIGGKHLPSNMRPWMGDSIGWWEGDTLVVETIQLNPDQMWVRSPTNKFVIAPNSKITERFTRVSPTEISYHFEVDEPNAYFTPWKAKMVFKSIKGPVYEYACHEGNRSIVHQMTAAKNSGPEDDELVEQEQEEIF